MRLELDPSDTELLQKLKDRALMLKTICLDEMGKSPLFDVSSMTKRDKIKLQVEVERKWTEMEDNDILRLFNEICTQTIFDENSKISYEHMTCESIGKPQLPEAEVKRISELPEEQQLQICGRVLKPDAQVLVSDVATEVIF